MNIDWALERMEEGHALTRRRWSERKFLKMRPTPRPHEPKIMQSWDSTRGDITADDWTLAEESVPNPLRKLLSGSAKKGKKREATA